MRLPAGSRTISAFLLNHRKPDENFVYRSCMFQAVLELGFDSQPKDLEHGALLKKSVKVKKALPDLSPFALPSILAADRLTARSQAAMVGGGRTKVGVNQSARHGSPHRNRNDPATWTGPLESPHTIGAACITFKTLLAGEAQPTGLRSAFGVLDSLDTEASREYLHEFFDLLGLESVRVPQIPKGFFPDGSAMQTPEDTRFPSLGKITNRSGGSRGESCQDFDLFQLFLSLAVTHCGDIGASSDPRQPPRLKNNGKTAIIP